MRINQGKTKYDLALWIVMFIFSPALLIAQPHEMTSNVLVWDTMVPLDPAADFQDRSKWQVVPTDLLELEAHPVAAMSDPSYYGRAYAFAGDTVVENAHLIVACLSLTGNMVLSAKGEATRQVEIVPLQLKGRSHTIDHCELIQNTGDETTMEISFSAQDGRDTVNAIFSLGRTSALMIKPGRNMTGVSLVSKIEYGVVPSFIGDDLVFDPRLYPAQDTLYIPSENLLMGLLQGQNTLLVATWPTGKQKISLSRSKTTESSAQIESAELETDGKNLYLALLNAPGIWHKEVLKRTYLEKDIRSDWQRPFPAKWKTQLLESKIKTTFIFKESKQDIWRGAVGSYTYPVWFDGDTAVYRLSKKIPPTGEAIVYFTERHRTPLSIESPVDILEASLGRDLCDEILDVPGRQLRTHHRRGAEGIRRACTCGCTEAIEAVFKAHEEADRKEYVTGAVEDMVYFVTRHVARIDEYQTFARDMIAFLERIDKSAGTSQSYIDSMTEIARELQNEYNRARDNMKTLAYADQLASQTIALTQAKSPDNLEACLKLGNQWRGMGGAQDDVIAQSHRLVRKLDSEAGYQAVNNPATVEIAKQIREKCRQCLRNPDGYEIWPNY